MPYRDRAVAVENWILSTHLLTLSQEIVFASIVTVIMLQLSDHNLMPVSILLDT